MLIILSQFSYGAETKMVRVLSYYEIVPFKITDTQGLSFDLIAQLNAASPPSLQFTLQHLPRNRINNALTSDEGLIVLLVNPAWFGDKEKTRYFWSESLFQDGNDVVSLITNPISYTGIESLKGKKMGALLGRKYGLIDKAVEDGDILREDVNDLGRNLRKLNAGYIDFTILSRTWSAYLINSQFLHGKFKRSPFKDFTRHLLMSHSLKPHVKFITDWVNSLNHSEQWQLTLKKYGIKQ